MTFNRFVIPNEVRDRVQIEPLLASMKFGRRKNGERSRNALYFLYSCLMKPELSSSRIKLWSTNAFGSAVAALGFFGARSSSMVLTPSGVGYGTSGKMLE